MDSRKIHGGLDPVQRAKEAKHAVFLMNKKAKRAPDAFRNWYAKNRPYVYDPERYRVYDEGIKIFHPTSYTFGVNHLSHPSEGVDQPGFVPEEIPHRIFCFWTGDNEMSPQRRRAFESIRRHNPDMETVLIDQSNLSDFVLPGHPLHPAYKNLSFIHRSDYLRGYFMHHHGGIYVDLKDMQHGWREIVDRANADDSIWACGPSEPDSADQDPATGLLGRDQRTNYSRVIFQAAFAFKPRTPWTAQWIAEVERRLSYFEDLLERFPAQDPFGLDGGYPVPWYTIHAQVLAPLSLRYCDHALLTETMRFVHHPDGHR